MNTNGKTGHKHEVTVTTLDGTGPAVNVVHAWYELGRSRNCP